MNKKNAALVASAVALVGAGGALAIGGVAGGTSTASEIVNAETDVPGERLDDYLGRNVGPAYWADELLAVENSISDCMQSEGLPYSVETSPVSDVAQLRADDVVGFAEQFGFGVTAEAKWEAEEARLGADATNKGHEFMANLSDQEIERYPDAVLECSSEAMAEIIEPHLAPTEVHQRAQALVREASENPAFVAAKQAFDDCMASEGYPDGGASAVVTRAFEMAEMPLRTEQSGEVRTLDLSEGQWAELQAYELAIWSVDQRCAVETGIDAQKLLLETQILGTLAVEFPSFEGVVR